MLYGKILQILNTEFGKSRVLENDDFIRLIEIYNLNKNVPLKHFLENSINITNYWRNYKMKETLYEIYQL